MQSYLTTLLTSAIAAWLLSGIAVFAAFQSGIAGLKTVTMLRHQVNKIANSRIDGSILLLGDSTLRATIDADSFSRLSGRNVINAGLNGAYGYAGDLNLLRRALARGRPSAVVLFHAADMITRPVSYQGFAQSIGDLSELREVPIGEIIRLYFSMDGLSATLKGALRWIFGESEPFSDTYEQGPAMSALDVGIRIRRSRYLPNEINFEKTKFLVRLVGLCSQYGLNCVYVHGPLYEGVCEDSLPYFAEANAVIESAGLIVVAHTPICMPIADTGDSEDHPAPSAQGEYEQRYYDLIAPYLK